MSRSDDSSDVAARSHIKLRNVKFSYPSRPEQRVPKIVNIHFEKGDYHFLLNIKMLSLTNLQSVNIEFNFLNFLNFHKIITS